MNGRNSTGSRRAWTLDARSRPDGEEINYGCAGIGTTMFGNNLAAMPLMLAGTAEQQKKWLSMLTEAPIFAAYACSEPDAGSDVAGMRTTVRKVGDEYVMTGQKRWITNARFASWYTVFGRIGEVKGSPQGHHLLRGSARRARRLGGQEGGQARPARERHLRRALRGREAHQGQPGWRRGLGLQDRDEDLRSQPSWIAAGATGIMRRALDECRRYALERRRSARRSRSPAVQFSSPRWR